MGVRVCLSTMSGSPDLCPLCYKIIRWRLIQKLWPRASAMDYCHSGGGGAGNPGKRARTIKNGAIIITRQDSHTVSGKVSLSETVHTPEYQCSHFERDPIPNRQPVEFLEQRRYIVIIPGPTD